MEPSENDHEERKPGALTRLARTLRRAVLGENIMRDLSLRSLSHSCMVVVATVAVVVLLRDSALAALPFALAFIATVLWVWAEHRLDVSRQREYVRATAAYEIVETALRQAGTLQESKEQQ
jgi:ABC-type bacteriocin/lantibiotic exporter with double-glycine peptidase domain